MRRLLRRVEALSVPAELVDDQYTNSIRGVRDSDIGHRDSSVGACASGGLKADQGPKKRTIPVEPAYSATSALRSLQREIACVVSGMLHADCSLMLPTDDDNDDEEHGKHKGYLPSPYAYSHSGPVAYWSQGQILLLHREVHTDTDTDAGIDIDTIADGGDDESDTAPLATAMTTESELSALHEATHSAQTHIGSRRAFNWQSARRRSLLLLLSPQQQSVRSEGGGADKRTRTQARASSVPLANINISAPHSDGGKSWDDKSKNGAKARMRHVMVRRMSLVDTSAGKQVRP
jgi:hypothetical protein